MTASTNSEREKALKPCPFCGASPEIEPWHGGPPTKVMISCPNDECRVSPQVTGRTKERAATDWNQRYVEDALRAELALAKQRNDSWEEREGSCCPEDVGFEEYIANLEGLLGKARAELAQIKSERARDAIDGQGALDEANNRTLILTDEADSWRSRSAELEAMVLAQHQELAQALEREAKLRTACAGLPADMDSCAAALMRCAQYGHAEGLRERRAMLVAALAAAMEKL